MNICNKEDVAKLLMGKQAGKKRPHDEDDGLSGFFSWFDKDNENEDFIGGPMKEIWEEPVKVLCNLSRVALHPCLRGKEGCVSW